MKTQEKAFDNLLNEGDIQSLKVMAQENGIPEDYVEMYQSGDIPYLCDAVTAAMGKLDVECGSLKLAGLMNDWVEYIRGSVWRMRWSHTRSARKERA